MLGDALGCCGIGAITMRAAQNAGEDVVKRMKTGGLPLGKKESQDVAWKRVLELFKSNLG